MIFFSAILLWIVLAKNIIELLIPFVLILIRTCYVTRRVRISPISSVTLLLMVFLFTYLDNNLDYATLIVVRIGLIILLFGHILESPKSYILYKILSFNNFRSFAYFFHYLERFSSLFYKRSLDIQYTIWIRIKRSKMTLFQKFKLLIRACISLFFETAYIIDQVNMVLASRGNIPAAKKWKDLPPLRWTIPLGDVILLIAVSCTLLSNIYLFPVYFHKLLASLR